MSLSTRMVVFLPLWIITGLATAFVMRRKGHDGVAWSALGVVFGPFTVPLASRAVRAALHVRPHLVTAGQFGAGSLDVLIGIDGSPESLAAAQWTADYFGPALHRVTLAAVLDADAAIARRGWGSEEACQRDLSRVADAIAGLRPSCVLLGGQPARALANHARKHGYDLLVVGPRGRGMSRALLGSVATQLSRGCARPVLIGPRLDPDEPAAAYDRTEVGSVDPCRPGTSPLARRPAGA